MTLSAPPPAAGPGGGGAPAGPGARRRAPRSGKPADTLAFVESPVQLLNVLEWAHAVAGTHAVAGGPHTAHGDAAELPRSHGPRPGAPAAPVPGPAVGTGVGGAGHLTVVVLPPQDPMTRGQLRRMAELARDEGHTVRWEEARGGAAAPLKTLNSLARPLRRASRVVVGDPFSRFVQLLLSVATAREVVVVDDGTATMEFVAQLARGERLTRWHRTGAAGGVRGAVFAPVAHRARDRLVPSEHRAVEVFSSMPVAEGVAALGVRWRANDFAWTRARFGPPRLTRGADLVGTSLVETGVVDAERYLDAVAALARAHGATRYFAHRRESAEKLRHVTERAGLEVVRPDLPLELVARRGPIGRTVLSFPSTVVHTLPLALAGTDVRVSVCDVDPAWLTAHASPRAHGFLTDVAGTASAATRLPGTPRPGTPGPATPGPAAPAA